MNNSVSTNPLSNVSQPRNSMWVSANAGSGKTRNLIIRVARLLLQGALPEKILCLTYTTAAATEMQERLYKELGSWSMKSNTALTEKLLSLDNEFFKNSKDSTATLNEARRLFAKALETPGGLKIQTIHSFCSGVLRKFPLEISVPPNFKILDERKKQELVTRTILEISNHNPQALDNITKILEVVDIRNFIEQVLNNKALLSSSFDLDAFCKCFGFSSQNDNIFDEATFIFDGLPCDIIKIVSNALLHGSNTDIKLANLLANVESSIDLRALEILEKFFCTQDGRLRSARSFPSKKAKLYNPKLEILFNKFKENFFNYLVRRNEINSIKKTIVLYDFSKIFFKIYERIKLSEGLLDYEDLIIKTRDLLLNYESKWVLYKLDGGIDHILLDEAQDTSVQQWEMLASLMDDFFSDERALSGERTFYAVGDEKQSIYSFQGADIKSFSFMKDFFSKKLVSEGNKLDSIELRNSFRSSKAILFFVNEILFDGGGTGISHITEHLAYHNDLPGRVELWPLVGDTERSISNNWWSFERESGHITGSERLADDIALQVKNILASNQKIYDPSIKDAGLQRQVLPGDFLILVRSRGPLFNNILKKLSDYNLPIAGSDKLFLLDELAVKDIVSLLKFLTNPFDDLSLAEALRSPLLGFSEKELFQVAYQRNCSLYQALKLTFPDHNVCVTLSDLLINVEVLPPYELIERVLVNYNGRLNMTARLGPSVNDVLDEFLTQALNYEEFEPPSNFGFLMWLDEIKVAVKRQLQNNSPNIRVMTIHGSKGLEAPIVIVPDTFNTPIVKNKRTFLQKEGWLCLWEKGPNLPQEIQRLKEQKLLQEEEEENRLFYVAITRARSWLIICGSGKNIQNGDSVKPNWYFRSEKALKRLSKEKPLLPNIEGKLIYDYNWDLGDYEKFTENKYRELDDFNSELYKKREKNFLFKRPKSISEVPSDLSVSELVQKLSNIKVGEVWRNAHPITFSEKKTVYGSVVHLFLQILPVYFEKNVGCVKDIIWQEFKNKLKDFDSLDRAFQEAKNILENPNLYSLLTDPCSFREVSVSSFLTLPKLLVDNEGGRKRIRGRIDLLNVAGSKVLIVDFKTSLNVPLAIKNVDPTILAQLELYARILSKAYPNHEITSAILWTKAAHLMKIPRINSDEALNTLFANQVLDGV